MKEYKAALGAMFNDEKAQVYGGAIDALQKRLARIVTPGDVLKEARKKRSALRGYFEWDDGVAGEKFRLHQARELVNHIEVAIVDDLGEEETTAAFIHVRLSDDDSEKTKGYLPQEQVWQNQELAEQVVKRAMKEAIGFRDRYRQYEALAKINQAITETAQELRVGNRVAAMAMR